MSEHEYNRRDSDLDKGARAIKWVAGMITSLAVIAGAATWAADTRYAQKAEVQTIVQFAVDQSRKTTLEDDIFKLTLIKPEARTDEQRALLDRALRQMNDLNARWQTPPPGGR